MRNYGKTKDCSAYKLKWKAGELVGWHAIITLVFLCLPKKTPEIQQITNALNFRRGKLVILTSIERHQSYIRRKLSNYTKNNQTLPEHLNFEWRSFFGEFSMKSLHLLAAQTYVPDCNVFKFLLRNI